MVRTWCFLLVCAAAASADPIPNPEWARWVAFGVGSSAVHRVTYSTDSRVDVLDESITIAKSGDAEIALEGRRPQGTARTRRSV